MLHQIARIFEGKACSEIQQSTLTLAKHLAHAVKGTFLNFEEIIEKDSTKTMVADGTVHPLSSYVINYMKFLFELVLTLPWFYLNISNWFGIHSSNSLICFAVDRSSLAFVISLCWSFFAILSSSTISIAFAVYLKYFLLNFQFGLVSAWSKSDVKKIASRVIWWLYCFFFYSSCDWETCLLVYYHWLSLLLIKLH